MIGGIGKILKLELIFLSLGVSVYGQNLVPNPGFESIKNCPLNSSSFDLLNNWFVARGTPDVFSNCNERSEVSIPDNFIGTQNAHSGNNYSGIILYDKKNPDYREWIKVALNERLKKGVKYKVTFFYSFAENSGFFVDKLGVLFEPNYNGRSLSEDIKNRKNYYEKQIIKNYEGWERFELDFVANGGESFLIIGLFSQEYKKMTIYDIDKHKVDNSWGNIIGMYSYFYIDDVSVEQVDDSKSEPPFFSNHLSPVFNGFEGDSIIIKFSKNSYELKAEELIKLDSLIAFLKVRDSSEIGKNITGQKLNNSVKVNVTVELNVYTADEKAKLKNNQDLGNSRIRSIKDYLVKHLGDEIIGHLIVNKYNGSKPINYPEFYKDEMYKCEIRVFTW